MYRVWNITIILRISLESLRLSMSFSCNKKKTTKLNNLFEIENLTKSRVDQSSFSVKRLICMQKDRPRHFGCTRQFLNYKSMMIFLVLFV